MFFLIFFLGKKIQISRKFNVLVDNAEDEHYGVTMRGTFIIDPQVCKGSEFRV